MILRALFLEVGGVTVSQVGIENQRELTTPFNIYYDLTFTRCWFLDLVDSNVVVAIISRCFHHGLFLSLPCMFHLGCMLVVVLGLCM